MCFLWGVSYLCSCLSVFVFGIFSLFLVGLLFHGIIFSLFLGLGSRRSGRLVQALAVGLAMSRFLSSSFNVLPASRFLFYFISFNFFLFV